jgi:hypothetical protein
MAVRENDCLIKHKNIGAVPTGTAGKTLKNIEHSYLQCQWQVHQNDCQRRHAIVQLFVNDYLSFMHVNG